jgi:hypothetical protein
METKKLVLVHIGRDDWDRPVYECDGRLYVDVDPREDRNPNICIKQWNRFNGEPLAQIADDIEIEFVPCRDIW